MGIFNNISPLDHRYRVSEPNLWDELANILSEEGYLRYQLQVEAALVQAFANRGMCSQAVAQEVAQACESITCSEVQVEEEITKHNIRALVNCIRERVSDEAKPFVHLTATSVDILDTGRALQIRDVTERIVLPKLRNLMRVWIRITRAEAHTPQIGRTHGQHGVPITFGFALSEYVSRLGSRLVQIEAAVGNLRGKMAGAVGAYNASSLFFGDPMSFEEEVLSLLQLKPAQHSTQIVEPEYVTDLIHSVVTAFGVLANFADDIRHLQRTEISEVGEEFTSGQVGSSTMPHKRNPWNYENVKSMWKEFMPRMVTVYLDQVSEHQRDLTNSASARFITEIFAAIALTTQRLIRVTSKLAVHEQKMLENLNMHGQLIAAEPMYIILASLGHPDAHEYVRQLTLEFERTGKSLGELAQLDEAIQPYLERMNEKQREIILNPASYQGVAAQKALSICDYWEPRIQGGE